MFTSAVDDGGSKANFANAEDGREGGKDLHFANKPPLLCQFGGPRKAVRLYAKKNKLPGISRRERCCGYLCGGDDATMLGTTQHSTDIYIYTGYTSMFGGGRAQMFDHACRYICIYISCV